MMTSWLRAQCAPSTKAALATITRPVGTKEKQELHQWQEQRAHKGCVMETRARRVAATAAATAAAAESLAEGESE